MSGARGAIVVVAALGAAMLGGCGGGSSSPSPSAPTPVPTVTDISGPWRGTWTSRHHGFSVMETASVTLTQSAAHALGTVSSADSGAAASAALSVSGSEISGSVRLNYSGGCHSTAQVTGSISGGRLRFATSSVPPTGSGWPCDWAQVQEFDFGR